MDPFNSPFSVVYTQSMHNRECLSGHRCFEVRGLLALFLPPPPLEECSKLVHGPSRSPLSIMLCSVEHRVRTTSLSISAPGWSRFSR